MFETSQVTTYTATLLGAKKFKGEIDGNKIDSCTVLVASPMPSNGNAVGFTSESMKFGDSHNFEKLKNLKFPCAVDRINRKRLSAEIVGFPSKGRST